MQGSLCSLFNFLELTNDHSSRYMYIDIYIDSIILTYGIKKNTLSAFANRKKKENMKKKIIDYLIDYACPIISDNRLWNFSDCTSLFRVQEWILQLGFQRFGISDFLDEIWRGWSHVNPQNNKTCLHPYKQQNLFAPLPSLLYTVNDFYAPSLEFGGIYLGPRKMRVPYSDWSALTVYLDIIFWCHMVVSVLDLHFMLEWPLLGRNGYVNITVPIGATFIKLTPAVHLDMIYWCHVVVCVLDLHFMLQWPRHKMAIAGPLWRWPWPLT